MNPFRSRAKPLRWVVMMAWLRLIFRLFAMLSIFAAVVSVPFMCSVPVPKNPFGHEAKGMLIEETMIESVVELPFPDSEPIELELELPSLFPRPLSSVVDSVPAFLRQAPRYDADVSISEDWAVGTSSWVSLVVTPPSDSRETPSDAQVPVSQVMIARLNVGPAFTVQPFTPTRQFINSEGETVWDWLVTPNQSGTFEGTITMEAELHIGSDSGPTYVRVADIMVQVKGPGFFEVLGSWVMTNLTWILGTIAIPLILLGATRFRTRNRIRDRTRN